VPYLETYLATLPQGITGSFLVYARKLCEFLESREPTRETLDAWLEHLRREQYAPGTIRFAFGVARRLFRVNNLPWPYLPREGPGVPDRAQYRPALAAEVIEAMIRASACMEAKHRAYLSLSTVYGMRRAEMLEIGMHSFDWRSHLLYVETVKHGRQRYHVVPEEIEPHLRAYSWPKTSLSTLSLLFGEMKEVVGLDADVSAELGWHGIRRSLDSALERSHLPRVDVVAFMRWKASQRDMAERYAMPSVVVGLDSRRSEISVSDEDLDRRVFAAIPWLHVWRDVPVGDGHEGN